MSNYYFIILQNIKKKKIKQLLPKYIGQKCCYFPQLQKKNNFSAAFPVFDMMEKGNNIKNY